MIMFARYVLLLTSLLFSVSALPLAPRDVVAPPITSPTAGTTWYVGQTQTVTWNASGLPVNQSNPVGVLVLGYQSNNSENLMLDSPLATNIDYSVGKVQITVPNVPTRTDYIVVLFGDSGNASPEFTIINGASSSTSVAPSPVTTGGSSGSTPAAVSTPAPGSGNPSSPSNSAGGSSPSLGAVAINTASGSATTVPSNQPTASHTSTVVTVTASSTASSTQSNAAWRKHAPGSGRYLGIALALIYFAFS